MRLLYVLDNQAARESRITVAGSVIRPPLPLLGYLLQACGLHVSFDGIATDSTNFRVLVYNFPVRKIKVQFAVERLQDLDGLQLEKRISGRLTEFYRRASL